MATPIDELKILVTAEVSSAIANLNKTEQATQKTGTSFKGLAMQIAGYTSVAGLAVSAGKAVIQGISQLAKESVTLAMGFESAKIQWGVLLGDMEDGAQMFSKIQALAAKTPLSFESVEGGARTLKQFGLATVDILPTIKMLGDVSMGNAEKLRGLSIVYGQVMSTGRLMGQDLLQLINQGFNPLKYISDKTGESMAELKKRMEKGGVSAQEVADAFKAATSEGGQFFGMMDKTAESASGRWSTALDNWKVGLASIGNRLLPAITEGLEQVSLTMSDLALVGTVDDIVKGKIKDYETITAAFQRSQEILARPDESGLGWLNVAKIKSSYETLTSLQSKARVEEELRLKALEGVARVEAIIAKEKEDEAKAQAHLNELMEEGAIWGDPRFYSDKAQGILEYKDALAQAAKAFETMLLPQTVAALTAFEDMGLVTGTLADSNAELAANAFDFYNNLNTGIDFGIAKTEELTELQKELNELMLAGAVSTLEAFGAALVTGEEGWKGFAKAGLNAVAAVIEALAAAEVAKGIAALASVVGAAAAPGYFAAGAGLYVAAGAIKAIPMAEGGAGITNGPTMFFAEKAGEPFAFGGTNNKRGMSIGGGVTINQYVAGSIWRENDLKRMAVGAVAGAGRGY